MYIVQDTAPDRKADLPFGGPQHACHFIDCVMPNQRSQVYDLLPGREIQVDVHFAGEDKARKVNVYRCRR